MPLFLFPPPSSFRLAPYVEIRERFERHVNQQFSGPADTNRTDLYSRLRLGADLNLTPRWSAKIEYQNAHDLYWTHKKNASTEDSDASIASLSYTRPELSVVGGRQRIQLNGQRLIGLSEWTNKSRSFDALRATSGAWDVWTGMLGVAAIEPRTARISVLTYSDLRWGNGSLILKHDVAAKGDIDLQTYDYYLNRPLLGGTFTTDLALQLGNNNDKKQEGWGFHTRYLHPLRSTTTLGLDVDAASGGSSSHVNRTFDNLYATNHDLHGLADTTSWKNMEHLAAWLEVRPSSTLTLKAAYHWLSLRDASDYWYGTSGVPNPRPGGMFIDPTGKSGRHLGDEFDLSTSLQTKRAGTFSGGAAIFQPGDFVRKLTGHSDQELFVYAMYQARFR